LFRRGRIVTVRADSATGPAPTTSGNRRMIVIDPLITIIQYALQLYVWVVIAAAILSWLVTFNVVNARNQVVYQIANALYRLTEPALRPIRRFLPNLGGIDISPVILLLIIYFLQMVLERLRIALFYS
jgi:YggT family protein